jgi:membrane peptidoglycan carboxypeptidase
MTLILLFFVLGGIFWLYILKDLPSPQNISTGFSSPSIRITDRNGKLLYEAFQQNGGRHLSVKSDQIPYALKAATVATEDRSFYSNSGVDWRGIIRAGWINLKQGRIVAGGSTITQQIARNLLLGNEEKNERTVVRKIKEIILALELARYYSKEELLTLYLNHTYYGAMAYGVEAAAQTYFGKPVEALSLAESAVIAGIPQAPALYNPYTNPDKAKQRQKTVLELMEKTGCDNP